MRSLLEKAIVHLLNGDQDKAEGLIHKFMVERAREIHESLRQSEDVQLNEGWDNEIQEEEYFDDIGDEGDAPMGDESVGDAPMGDESMGDEPAMGDESGMDDMGDESDVVDDEDADLEGMGDEPVDIESKLDGIEDKMEELSAEFDRLMAKLDAGDMEDVGDDDLDDLDSLDSDDDGLGGDDLEGGDGDEFGAENEGEEDDELADQMDTDFGDDDQPEHKVAEEADPEMDGDDEMLEDITESVLAELEKVTLPSNTEGKEIGSGGKSVSPRSTDSLPHHPARDRVNQAKPVMVKAVGDAHNDSFERETPPTNKEVKRRRNNDAGVKKLTKVPAKGDASAKLNSDFASRPTTQSTIDGKKSK